jgi:hypothetical protein
LQFSQVAEVTWNKNTKNVSMLIEAFSLLCFFFAVVSGSVYSTVDIFNVSSGTWATASLSVARWQLAAASLPGVGLAFFAGGSSEGLSLVLSKSMTMFTQTRMPFYTLKMRSSVSLAQPRHTPLMQRLIFLTASLANGALQLSVSPVYILLARRCPMKIWSCLLAVQVCFFELQALPPLTDASQMQPAQQLTPTSTYTTRPLVFGALLLLAVLVCCSLRHRCHCKA